MLDLAAHESAAVLEGTSRACVIKHTGGRKGLRLPSVVELSSLMDTAYLSRSLPTDHPFTNVVPGFLY